MNLTKRNILNVLLLSLFTIGIYIIYWTVVTKNELNRLGADIPTALLFIIPFANFYFIYKFAQAFSAIVLKDEGQTVAYFLLFTLLMPFAPAIYQVQMNKVA